MVKLGLFVAAMFLLQAILSSIQISHFNKEFIKLRRRGKVACGRQSGGFHAGAIVMFLLDESGVIQEGKMLMGVTCLARVKPLPGFEGKFVGALYNKVMRGEIVPDRPSPFQRVGQALSLAK